MIDACTVDLFDRESEMPIPATGYWNVPHRTRPDSLWSVSRLATVAGLVFSLAASSVTAMPDVWLLEKRRRDRVVTISIYKDVIGRPISRSEALWIVSQILEEAEQERLAYSQFEAARGIQWGDEA